MVQDKLSQISQLATEAAAELPGELQAAKDQGFAEGAASVGSDKIYSQADLDQRLADQASGYEATIAELNTQVAGFPLAIEQAKEAGKAELKAELKAAYEQQQVAESQGETGFGALLS